MQKPINYYLFRFLLPIGLLLGSLIFVESAFSSTLPFQGGGTVVVTQNEVIERDFYAGGERIEIAGTVNGDVYAGGGQILISGTVNGDLLVGGGTVTITGRVTQDIRAAGGQVNLSGEVGRNVTVAGGNIDLSTGARISGNVTAAGGNISINTALPGNLTVVGGNVIVANSVSGDITAGVGELRLATGARVGGDLNYWSEQQASVAPDASVSGQINYHQTEQLKGSKPEEVAAAGFGIAAFFKLISFVSTLVLGFLMLYLFPSFFRFTYQTALKKPVLSIALGFGILVLTPILFILLLITVFGLPLAFILLFSFIVLLYISRVYGMYIVGRWILGKLGRTDSYYLGFFAGSLIYFALGIIPVIGDILAFLILLLGLGSSVLSKRESYQELSKKGKI